MQGWAERVRHGFPEMTTFQLSLGAKEELARKVVGRRKKGDPGLVWREGTFGGWDNLSQAGMLCVCGVTETSLEGRQSAASTLYPKPGPMGPELKVTERNPATLEDRL